MTYFLITLMIFQIMLSTWLIGLVSPLTLTIIAYYIYFGIGLIILSIEHSNFFAIDLLLLGTFSLFLGFIFSYFVKNLRLSKLNNINSHFITTTNNILISDKILYFFIVISILMYLYIFLVILRGLPIFNPALRDISKGNIGDIAELMFKAIITLSFSLWIFGNIQFKKIFFLSFILFLCINILLLVRHPILDVLLMLMFIYSSKKRIRVSHFIVVSFLIISIIIILGAFRIFIYNKSLSNLSQIIYITIYKRLFMIGSETLYYIFNNWKHDFGFYWGLSFIKRVYNLLIPNQIPNLGYLLYEKVTGYFGAYDPVSLIGQMYINFGISGIILGMYIIGMMFGYILRYLKSRAIFDPIFSVLYAFIALMLIRTFAYSLQGVILSIIEFSCILFLIYKIDNILKIIVIFHRNRYEYR